jgi:flagellar motor switch protein FliN/FliY
VASFNRDTIEQVVNAWQASQAEAAQAFGRALEKVVEVTVGQSGRFDLHHLPAECRGAGLILALHVGPEAALVLLPESSGLVPETWRQTNAPPSQPLSTLASELGRLVIPAPFITDRVSAGYVSDLEAALQRSDLSPETVSLAIHVRSGETSGVVSMVWPASAADAAFREVPPTPRIRPSQSSQVSMKSHEPQSKPSDPPQRIQYEELEDGLGHLPCYSRSLLKIKVPVMVTLAEAKQPVENVLNIGPGSIIHFNKPCEDTLTLEVAGQKIAVGEAVKVGDKFGLWITAMILPEERFWVISNRSVAERAK